MVTYNAITKQDGDSDYGNPRNRPRKFLFAVGEYNVAIRRRRSYEKNSEYIYTQIWHKDKKIGYLDLITTYVDVKTIMSVQTMINSDYQGLGIAYRVYEGLVTEANIAIASDNQSPGAVKLWLRFADNNRLRLYHVNDHGCANLFDCAIHAVVLNQEKRQLETIDYHDNRRSPYRTYGSLLLVAKNNPLDATIQNHIKLRKQILKFRDFDKFNLN